ncbi:hypothetical protein PybrP1_007443 [[Pythium] brassicae (nom. inval.)]|nr:hypothetical protein PybrP1_007443 [[Pythium] brassicae (nom. inval.)]
MATTDAPSTLPKLYVYDHCPYCVRARAIFGLKKVPHELVFLASHDEATPIGLVGVKQAPILLPPGGKAFAESMDIVRFVDANYGGSAVLQESADREDIKQWIKDSGDAMYRLFLPRFHAAHLPEFALKESREYFRAKKEQAIGPFSEALARTPELVAEANAHLERLAELFHSNRSLREFMDYMAEAADVPLFDSMAKY